MANFKHFTIVAIVAVCTAAFVLNISDEPKKPEPAPLANTKTNEPVQRDKIPQDSVTKPIRYVSDYENIYIRKEEKILTDLIARFEKNTQVQIALITIDSSMTTKDNLDAFTLKIANEWGIGQTITGLFRRSARYTEIKVI